MMHTRLVITKAEGALALIHWGRRFAEAQGTPLEVLVVSQARQSSREPINLLKEGEEDPPALITAVRDAAWSCWRPPSEHAESAQAGATEEGTEEGTEAGAGGDGEVLTSQETSTRIPQLELWWVQHPDPIEGVMQCLEDTHTLLVPCTKAPKGNAGGLEGLPMVMFQRAPCTVVLLRTTPLTEAPSPQILVPLIKEEASGSELAALKISRDLVADDGRLHVLNTISEGVEDFDAVGRRIVERKMSQCKLKLDEQVEVHTEAGEDPWAGLKRHLDDHTWLGDEGATHTLMLTGAERWTVARRVLFGAVPDNRIRSAEGMSVGVIRKRRPLGARLRSQADRWLALTLPQMTREGRIELSSRLETGSAWGYDFMVLISLATAIAALGLIQGSGAVVIGAMLVAPLMTPLLGSGLALVQGNVRLVRTAIRAVALGFATALILGVIIGLLAPTRSLTGELLARGAPNILDLGVAFLSGIAAAFALSRPGLLAALPGVSIAAALVPPIATTGITLAWGHPEVAWKSALLFGTNVVAIILGSAVALWAGGIRPRDVNGKSWTGRVVAGLMVAMAVLAVVLTVMFFENRKESADDPEQSVMAALQTGFGEAGATLTSAELTSGGLVVHIEAPSPLQASTLKQISTAASKANGDPVKLVVKTTLVTTLE
ncbi:MAG: DUF389 domain-containing protein [Bradymonadia bacterium]